MHRHDDRRSPMRSWHLKKRRRTLSTHRILGLPWGPSPHRSPVQGFVALLLLRCLQHVSCLLQPPRLNHTSDQGLTREVSDIAVASKSRQAGHGVPKIVHRTRFSNTRSLLRSRAIRLQDSEPYRTIGRRTTFQMRSFVFRGSIRLTRRRRTANSPLLAHRSLAVTSWDILLSLVNCHPRYLKLATPLNSKSFTRSTA